MGTSTFATTTLSTLWGTVPLDWLIIASLVIILALISLRLGGGVASAFGVAWLVVPVLLSYLPSAAVVASSVEALTDMQSVILILVAVVVVAFALYRMNPDLMNVAPFPAIVGSVGAVIIALVVWLGIPELDLIWNFGDQVESIFAQSYRLWWLVAGFFALVFARL